MQIQTWERERGQAGTLPYMARELLDRDENFKAAEETIRNLAVFESLMRNGGNLTGTSELMGLSRTTVRRAIYSLGFTANDVRVIARYLDKKAQ